MSSSASSEIRNGNEMQPEKSILCIPCIFFFKTVNTYKWRFWLKYQMLNGFDLQFVSLGIGIWKSKSIKHLRGHFERVICGMNLDLLLYLLMIGKVLRVIKVFVIPPPLKRSTGLRTNQWRSQGLPGWAHPEDQIEEENEGNWRKMRRRD